LLSPPIRRFGKSISFFDVEDISRIRSVMRTSSEGFMTSQC
ncbi:hypothetical protein SAMN04488026_11357, partial [Aliiruegeria lutimaris]